MNLNRKFIVFVGFILAFTRFTFAEDSSAVSERLDRLETAASAAQSNADNAWMLICAALVLLMTVPGMALFYSGLVRQKNVISTILQSLILAGVVTILWAVFGYSL